MLYAVLFEDNVNLSSDLRREHMPSHLAFLERNGSRIKSGWTVTSIGRGSGGRALAGRS